MPPLSNLEVMGEPYLTRLEGHIVLIVPLRVNVNIKSKTMDELTSTRKDVLLSAIKDLHAESEQEVSELAQAMGEVTALVTGQETEPEWFNDQVVHRTGNEQTSSSDFVNRDILFKRRRKDRME